MTVVYAGWNVETVNILPFRLTNQRGVDVYMSNPDKNNQWDSLKEILYNECFLCNVFQFGCRLI